jgi:hypothetical protein
MTNVDQCARAQESEGKRLNGGYAIVGSAFGGKMDYAAFCGIRAS